MVFTLRRHMATWPAANKVHTIIMDFDGIFTDNKVYLNKDGEEWVRCDRADGLGFDFLRKEIKSGTLQAEILILSKEKNTVVNARARKLGIPCIQGIDDKLAYIKENIEQREINPDSFKNGSIYLGNDLNDLPIMQYAGFTVAPVDAHPLVKKAASVVLNKRGGDGFIRLFVEKFLRIDKMSLNEVASYVHNC